MLLAASFSGCGGTAPTGAELPPAADEAAAAVAAVDRFADGFATMFKRSDPIFNPTVMGPLIPGPNQPIDYDTVFLARGLGPAGERITYYALDITSDQPGRAFEVHDASGAPIDGQLPIVELVPGEPGYNDFLRVHEVRVEVDEYEPNQIASVADVDAAIALGAVTLTPSSRVVNWALVPEGTVATRKFDGAAVAGYRAWRGREIVHYLSFDSALPLTGDLRVPASGVSVIFENGTDPSEGFATESDGVQTHNVMRTLPGDSTYSSSWYHQMGRRSGFDAVVDWPSAIANYAGPLPITVNCPIVAP